MEPPGTTDYDRERSSAERDIAELRRRTHEQPTDVSSATRLLYRRYHLATLTGRVDDLPAVREDVDVAVAASGPGADLALLRAQIDGTLHRFRDVPGDLALANGLAESAQGRAIGADLLLGAGDIDAARADLLALLDSAPDWTVLSRLAHLEQVAGDDAAADDRYAEAQDQLDAKQMRAFCWLELERARIDRRNCRLTDAADHVDRADRSFSGSWFVDEAAAAVRHDQGDLDDAISLQRRALARSDRPTGQEALGRLLLLAGRRADAEVAFATALADYLASIQQGEVHYLHHLADFHATVRRDEAAADTWGDEAATSLRDPPTLTR